MEITNVPRLMISAPQKSSGKTTVSLGLLSHLVESGVCVQSYKKGPDYIDPMWLKMATQRDCYNLDPYIAGAEGCQESFFLQGKNADLLFVEGNHGLHDGISLDGKDSSAGLANLLETPVLLVVDSRGMNRSIAAIIKGLQMMQPEAKIAGVILNHVKSARQEGKQKLAIETYCQVPVVGAIPHEPSVSIPERHLGLTTVQEMDNARKIIGAAKEVVREYCDVDTIQALFESPSSNQIFEIKTEKKNKPAQVKIGVFHDPAFCFYYPENLEALKNNGAELVTINSIEDKSLPDVDGLYIGGGFPESFFDEISANCELLSELKDRIQSGIPTYAECGGLIYLSESAQYKGKKYSLTGALPYEIAYQKKPVGYGYISLESRCQSKWFKKGALIKAHEFHYSKPIQTQQSESIQRKKSASNSSQYQFNVVRGFGIDGKQDGYLSQNLFASFAHLHASANPQWAEGFVTLASEYQH